MVKKNINCCVCFEEIKEKYTMVNCGHPNACHYCLETL